jgi:hypothetical protein
MIELSDVLLTLRQALNDVESEISRPEVSPAALEDFKVIVDSVRTSVLAILTAADPTDYHSFSSGCAGGPKAVRTSCPAWWTVRSMRIRQGSTGSERPWMKRWNACSSLSGAVCRSAGLFPPYQACSFLAKRW